MWVCVSSVWKYASIATYICAGMYNYACLYTHIEQHKLYASDVFLRHYIVVVARDCVLANIMLLPDMLSRLFMFYVF